MPQVGAAIACHHCGLQAPPAVFEGELAFCCNGCYSVYQILSENSLAEGFYKLQSDSKDSPRPVSSREKNYSFLNDPLFQSEFINERRIKFYLEGIHCLACLWLLEKIPQFVEGVEKSQLDFGRSLLTIDLQEKFDLADIAHKIHQLGYNPHPLRPGENSDSFRRKEERAELLRIGLAGASAGNIMLYSIAVYAGASGIYLKLFNILNLALILPVMTFSARPFFKSAYAAYRTKQMNIDVPIAAAIFLAFFYSLYGLLTNNDHTYFDSIAVLVFLLSLSRYFVKKLTQSGLNSEGLDHFFQNQSIKKILPSGEIKTMSARYLTIGDHLIIDPGQVVPADGNILKGSGYSNMALLTGESAPVAIKERDPLWCGTEVIQGPVEMIVNQIGKQTRLGQILEKIDSPSQGIGIFMSQANKITRYFVWSILLLALITFIAVVYWVNPTEAIHRALGLIIISCPCALGLATPLAIQKGLSLARGLGFLSKEESLLEKLHQVKTIFFDKTGTLTFGELRVAEVKIIDSKFPVASLVLSLEKHSVHPVARALKSWSNAQGAQAIEIFDIREYSGKGIQGIWNGHQLFLGQSNSDQIISPLFTNATLTIDGKAIATFVLLDILRPEIKDIVIDLKKKGLELIVLSGDRQEVVDHLTHSIPFDQVRGEISPEEKAAIVSSRPRSMMIGDGANDAIALKQALVGISVKGCVDLGLKASNAMITREGLSGIPQLLLLGHNIVHLIKRNLLISLAYNSVAIIAAITGHITPLWAAIFMPLSSVSVLISSLIGTNLTRVMFKEVEN